MFRRLVLFTAAAAVFAALSTSGAAQAATPLNGKMQSYVDGLLSEARKGEPGLSGFSPDEGKRFFNSKRTHTVKKEERSCSSCHTSDPAQKGKTPVGKVIEPLAPSVNRERFTDPAKVEKWFKRNCENVLERECTAKERGDFISYMISL